MRRYNLLHKHVVGRVVGSGTEEHTATMQTQLVGFTGRTGQNSRCLALLACLVGVIPAHCGSSFLVGQAYLPLKSAALSSNECALITTGKVPMQLFAMRHFHGCHHMLFG